MANGSGPCPRTVTVRITNGTVTVQPSTVNIDSDCQLIQWNLVTDGSGTFRTPPVTFPWPIPPGAPQSPCGSFSRWRGTVIQTGPMQFEGNARERLEPGSPLSLCYKYNIEWKLGDVDQTFDPDIKNDPYPPSGGQEHGGGHHGGGGPRGGKP
jgi:hypothetical protein